MSHKSPAIISAATVEEVARHTVRWTSLGVLAVSFIGTIMAFNGSWPTTWKRLLKKSWLPYVNL